MIFRKTLISTAKTLILATLAIGSVSANADAEQYVSDRYSSMDNVRISANGRYIAYSVNINFGWVYEGDKSYGIRRVNLYDRHTNTEIPLLDGTIVSECYWYQCPQQWDMSRDGKNFVFESVSSTFVENDTNNKGDIFLLDIASGNVSLITKGINSQSANGSSYGPTISTTGKYITYYSKASNLVVDDENGSSLSTFVFNVETGETTQVDHSMSGDIGFISSPDISADGKFVLSDNAYGNPLSLMNTENSSQTLLSDGGGSPDSFSKLSADGRFALFHRENWDSFRPLKVHDTRTGQTIELSVSTDGSNTPVNVDLGQFSVSGNGRFIAFTSKDNGLVEGDTDYKSDVFVYDRVEHKTARINGDIEYKSKRFKENPIDISEDGHYIVFDNYVTTNPLFASAEYCQGYEEF